jgi:cell wall-associated NlpC family hydrolase
VRYLTKRLNPLDFVAVPWYGGVMIESLLMVSALAQPTEPLDRGNDRASRQAQTVVGRAIRNRDAGYINGRWHGCMGFVRWSYAPYKSLPNYSGAMWNRGKKVSRKNLKPGDILLYGPRGSQHASIYIGRGKQIGANNARVGVQIDRIDAPWWKPRYAGARRVL